MPNETAEVVHVQGFRSSSGVLNVVIAFRDGEKIKMQSIELEGSRRVSRGSIANYVEYEIQTDGTILADIRLKQLHFEERLKNMQLAFNWLSSNQTD